MVVEKLSELSKNNVGIARSGPQKGCYVHVERYTDKAWLLYWSKPLSKGDTSRLGVDASDDLLGSEEDALSTLNSYLQVDWLAEPKSSEIYAEYFDLQEPPRKRFLESFRTWFSKRG